MLSTICSSIRVISLVLFQYTGILLFRNKEILLPNTTTKQWTFSWNKLFNESKGKELNRTVKKRNDLSKI